MSTFTVDAYQNEYLPLGGSEVNAIVTVTSDGAAGDAGRRERRPACGGRDRDRRHLGVDGRSRAQDPGRPRGDRGSRSTASATAFCSR